MRKRLIIFFGLLLVGLACNFVCQPAFADNNMQFWTPVTLDGKLGHGKISKRVLYHLDAQARTYLVNPPDPDKTHLNQLFIRPVIGFQLTKHISVWQGYGWTPKFNPEFQNENRLFQQVSVKNEFNRFDLENRTRLEERFIKGAGETSYRLRHKVEVEIPIGRIKTKEDKEKSKWAFAAYDEFFVTFNKTPDGPAKGFDQNRLFVGLQRKLTPHTKLQFGYLNQYKNEPTPEKDQINHCAYVALKIKVN